jgi:hypothetical protein
MKQNELRKVKYTFGQPPIFDGSFHQWLTKKDKDGSEYAVGLIEDFNGNIREVEAKYIFFQD